MAEPDWTLRVVLASMFAMMLAMGSLALPWFSATNLEGRYCEFTMTQYYVSGDDWRDYDTGWGFSDMGSLIGLAVLLIILWGLLAIAHVGLILSGETGIISGILLMGASAASVLIPCVGAESAIVDGLADYYTPSSPETVSVALTGGCLLAIIAAIIQVLAVAARLILVRPGAKRKASQDANMGDLPVR